MHLSPSKANLDSSDSSDYSDSSDCSDSSDYDEFPYEKKDIYKMLKTPPIKGQRMYNTASSQHMIKYALQDMERYGYDFAYQTKRIQHKHKQKKRNMRRQVYIQFRCENCPDKRFTSIVGTFEVKFVVKKLKDGRKNPFLIQFNPRIYRMQCLQCKKYAYPMIYDSQLKACELSFCYIVDEIMKNIKPEKKVRKGKTYLREIHNHKSKNCQACLYGICIAKRDQDEKFFQQKRKIYKIKQPVQTNDDLQE